MASTDLPPAPPAGSDTGQAAGAGGRSSPAITAGRRFGGLLRQRDFRLLWTGETTSQFGNSMAAVAMPLLVVTVLHASTFVVGVLTAVTYLPWLLISLPVGAWVDRLPSRKVMVASDLVAAVLYASVPVAAWFGVLRIGQVLAVALLAGSATVFFDTAYQVQLPALVPADALVEGNAKLQASMSAAQLSGPGLSGLVAEAMGVASALMFNAASFLVSAGCLLGIRGGTAQPAPPEPGPRTSLRSSIAEGMRFVARDPYLRPMVIWAAVVNFGLTGYDALIIVFLVRGLHLPSGIVGLLIAAGGLGGILGTLAAGSVARCFGTARGLLLTTTVVIPLVLLIPLAGPGVGLLCYVAGILFATMGIAVANVITASFRQTYTPPRMRGRVTATAWFVLNGIYPAGALLGGGLGTWLGLRKGLWLSLTVVALAGACLLTRKLRRCRDLPAGSAGTQPATSG